MLKWVNVAPTNKKQHITANRSTWFAVNDGDLEALEEELHEYSIYDRDLDIVFDQEELEDSIEEGE